MGRFVAGDMGTRLMLGAVAAFATAGLCAMGASASASADEGDDFPQGTGIAIGLGGAPLVTVAGTGLLAAADDGSDSLLGDPLGLGDGSLDLPLVPLPGLPLPSDPASSDDAPTDPAPSNPLPSDPLPSDPVPSDPVPGSGTPTVPASPDRDAASRPATASGATADEGPRALPDGSCAAARDSCPSDPETKGSVSGTAPLGGQSDEGPSSAGPSSPGHGAPGPSSLGPALSGLLGLIGGLPGAVLARGAASMIGLFVAAWLMLPVGLGLLALPRRRAVATP